MISRQDEHRSRSIALCRRLAERISQIAPVGIGAADWVWEYVDEWDVAFIIALSAWEADPNEQTKDAVKNAYEAVLRAWRDVSAEFARQRDTTQ